MAPIYLSQVQISFTRFYMYQHIGNANRNKLTKSKYEKLHAGLIFSHFLQLLQSLQKIKQYKIVIARKNKSV